MLLAQICDVLIIWGYLLTKSVKHVVSDLWIMTDLSLLIVRGPCSLLKKNVASETVW